MARMFHDWDIPTVNTQVAKTTTPDASADRDSRGAASIPARLPKVAQVLPTDYRAGEREDQAPAAGPGVSRSGAPHR